MLVFSFYLGRHIEPNYGVSKVLLDVDKSSSTYFLGGNEFHLDDAIRIQDSQLLSFDSGISAFDNLKEKELVYDVDDQGLLKYYQLELKKSFKIWSLFPAFLTLFLCWILREPVVSLLLGIISGAMILKYYNVIDQIFIPILMTKNSALIILLYFFLLGGLLGMWSLTGADRAFAGWMTKHFVKGPISAKVVAWLMGVIFFQGGTVSVVLVGTMVKPLADQHNVSPEELAYIVDSTASPIASQLAFNAWPAYIQSFIFVSGVSWLATESARIAFFFKSVPFCFYAIFAVFGTFMLSIDKPIFVGKLMKNAIKRSRETNQLDSVLGDKKDFSLDTSYRDSSYQSSLMDFVVPLIILIVTSLYTFIVTSSPNVLLAFSLSVLSIVFMSLFKGLSITSIIKGLVHGMSNMTLGLLILVCALCIGKMTVDLGAPFFMVQLLGKSIPYWLLPVFLQLLTVVIAFSTGTSWGTYAITFPIAMPLAWSIAQVSGLDNPILFMTLCFAAVMDGSVFGDQCSPISDTTVLSSMCTGCDLMDHVKTQLPQAMLAAVLAALSWTFCTLMFV